MEGFVKALKAISSSVLSLANGPRRITLLITGLDSSGKTTLLHFLRNPKDGHISASSHTRFTDIAFTTADGKRLVLNGIDLGGFQYRDHPGGIQQLWRDVLEEPGIAVGGVVFVVDAADAEQFENAAALLKDLGEVLEELEMKGASIEPEDAAKGKGQLPVLVLGNKIDAYGAVSDEELRQVLGLPTQKVNGSDVKARPIELSMCSVVMGQGYREGFEWLTRQI